MNSERVAIIGAGPTGMATAYVLAQAGVTVHVYEAAPHVGGLTRSFSLWGETVDLGPHIFAGYDDATLALWKQVVGPEHRMLTRDTRIAIGGRVYRYPLKPGALLRGLGARGSLRAGLGYLNAQVRARGDLGSAERFFTRRFGRHLYATFFRPYCQKLWGLDPAQVDEAFAAAIVGDISLARTLANLLRRRVGAREASLQTQFPYALAGSGAFCERAAKRIVEAQGSVTLGAPVTRLVQRGDRITGVVVGDRQHAYDWVVSTMPLPALLARMESPPEAIASALSRLRFRSTVLVYLRVRGRGILPCLWMYVNDGVAAGRITNFARWQGKTDAELQTIAVEYWCERDDPLWSADDASLRERATAELTCALGHARTVPVEAAHVVRVPSSHPLYYRGFRADVALVSRYLARIEHLSVVGRGGAYEYDAQARALDVGMRTARGVLRSLRPRSAMAHRAAPPQEPRLAGE